MRKFFPLLLALAIGAGGCTAKQASTVVKAALDSYTAPAALAPPPSPPAPVVASPVPQEAPAALPAAIAPSPVAVASPATPDPVAEALRQAWAQLKASHVPAKAIEIAVRQVAPQLSSFPMPADPGSLDLSTGGLGALLLAVLAVLVKKYRNSSSTSTR